MSCRKRKIGAGKGPFQAETSASDYLESCAVEFALSVAGDVVNRAADRFHIGREQMAPDEPRPEIRYATEYSASHSRNEPLVRPHWAKTSASHRRSRACASPLLKHPFPGFLSTAAPPAGPENSPKVALAESRRRSRCLRQSHPPLLRRLTCSSSKSSRPWHPHREPTSPLQRCSIPTIYRQTEEVPLLA